MHPDGGAWTRGVEGGVLTGVGGQGMWMGVLTWGSRWVVWTGGGVGRWGVDWGVHPHVNTLPLPPQDGR